MGIIENGEIEEGSDDKIYKKLRLENWALWGVEELHYIVLGS